LPVASGSGGGTTAYGSYLGSLTAKLADIVRPSIRVPAPVTRIARFRARRVLCWPAFPLVPVLGSTGSAADRSALFVGFVATTTESDFSGSCIIGYAPAATALSPSLRLKRFI
jgi:hypothetical protein